jgi:hypothetical protein
MSLPKNGAAVHFILSDSILCLLEIPNSVCINRSVYRRFEGCCYAVAAYITSEWGAPAVKALQTAAEAYPMVAKVIAHGLADAT